MNALNTINFTSRATYLTFVAAWKAQHAQLILDIRAAKIAIKEADRKKASPYKAYGDLYRLRQDIIASEALRAASKIEAQRQYVAEHAEDAVAA